MKQQGSNNRRSRSRGGGKRHSGGGGGGRNSFESNGPDVKIHGSAQQVQEKYLTLARDAGSSGDWVSAEAYYQFAEHYHRISNTDGNNPGGKTQGQGQSRGEKQDQGSNAKTQEPRVAQAVSSVSDGKADKGEVEVIDTSPAALAAAVSERESQEANAQKVAEAPVEAVVEAAPETAPKKAAS